MSDSKVQSNNSGEGISDDPCAICLGDIDNLSTTDVCSHTFCFHCIERWSKEKNVCPVCKRQFAEIFHDFNEDGTHSTLKVQNTDVLRDIFDEIISTVNRLFGENGIINSSLRMQSMTSQERMSMLGDIARLISSFREQLRSGLNRDSDNEQSGLADPQIVFQEVRSSSSNSEGTEGLPRRVRLHITISASLARAAPDEESDPEGSGHNPDPEQNEPSSNPEENEEATPNEPSTSNKRSRYDEDNQSEQTSKRPKI